MAVRDSKHWMHPQAVPRGFLRLYLLSLLSRSAETGYSIMQTIDERTEGDWRPGPGTVYPLLRSLVKEGLAEQVGSTGKESSGAYVATQRGKKELSEMQRALASAGRREKVMMRLFADLLPASVISGIMVNRARESSDLFREKIIEVPRPERDSILKEMQLVLETQSEWLRTQVSSGTSRKHLVTRR
jgi:DNA-binding PadR family transcriptional regulator